MKKGINIPNLLTLSRIVLIPVMVSLFFFPSPTTNWLLVGLFLCASITDFLDGFIARQWDQISPFGKFLDPVADKLLVSSILMMLVGTDRIEGINLIPAVVILCREVLVSGLREYLAQLRHKLPVSMLSKWKTAFQMVALTVFLSGIEPFVSIGLGLLWLAALLTVISGYDYLVQSLKHF